MKAGYLVKHSNLVESPAAYYDNAYTSTMVKHVCYPWEVYDEIILLLKKRIKPRILEIGCGPGKLAKKILDEGWKYKGFDFSKQGIERSKELCPEGEFVVADAYKADSYLGDYDTAIIVEVLEHVADDCKVLSLIPEGVFVIASAPLTDAKAHVRIYENADEDIIKRYEKILRIDGVKKVTRSLDSSLNPTRIPGIDWFLFWGIKVKKEEMGDL